MDTRRDFIRKTAMLSGSAAFLHMLPPSIQKAMAINPEAGTTFLDAEHVVILMQENRSFDHTYGTLNGVRGFNDPRAIRLPDNNKVWLQSDEKKNTYVPFRYDLKDTKITWMSSLPHSWEDQVDARNNGRHDRWLEVKKSGNAEYKNMPLAMGYFTREDIPFYYALADAFTICDQNFCSSLTGTTPNRLYFWSGTIREKQHVSSKANVRNSDVDYGKWASWKTFPERLEENGISWKIYQNELSLPVGLSAEEEDWLANFTDNALEWFSQYHVRFSPGYQEFLVKQQELMKKEIAELEQTLRNFAGNAEEKQKREKALAAVKEKLRSIKEEIPKWTREEFEKLSAREKNLHSKAFTTNINDQYYHELTEHRYVDNGTERAINIPRGDVLHQFRTDVNSGNLPQVSWLVAPSRFSDHPGGPWYGVWYLSETLDILTRNPEVWKKTIFILAYDENDGYFDHVPPFVAPDPRDPSTGKSSEGIDGTVEQVDIEQEAERARSYPGPGANREGRSGPIGLGFRVPLVVASPWSRGGAVCSQVFDHTSILQFLEIFTSHKSGKKIKEENISEWRRTVCGDLTSVFRPYNGEPVSVPEPVKKNEHIELITNAQFKEKPSQFRALSKAEIDIINKDPKASPLMPKQEKGIRASRPLPYELYADGKISSDKRKLTVVFSAGNRVFGNKAQGAPFLVYATGVWKGKSALNTNGKDVKTWNFAVKAGDAVESDWLLQDFDDNGNYALEVYGPNGFYRSMSGSNNDPAVEIFCEYQQGRILKQQLTGNIRLQLRNSDNNTLTLIINDNAYGAEPRRLRLGKKASKETGAEAIIDLTRSFGWYDFTVRIEGNDVFERRFAGHVETGKESFTDPVIGGTV